MGSNYRKAALYFLLVVSVLGIAFVLDDLYNDFGPLDSLGEASNNCVRQDYPSVPNAGGMIATVHDTTCDFGLAHGAETTYIYLHRLGEGDSRRSLVFRYANLGNLVPPHIAWSDNLNLHISVPAVGEVTKRVTSVSGIRIFYSIDRVDVSPERSSSLIRHDAEVLFAWLAFLTGIFALTVKLIRKQKPKTV
jgi:hypothetical protein